MAYSTTADLLTGNIPLPSYLDPQKFINDAADEIDSRIGFTYQTPVDIEAPTNVTRPVILFLKRISNWLASGRLLLAAAASAEDTQLHAYAYSLVRDAETGLQAIVDGDIVLEGAALANGGSSTVVTNAPLISNGDTESLVDAFYSRVTNPAFNGADITPVYFGN